MKTLTQKQEKKRIQDLSKEPWFVEISEKPLKVKENGSSSKYYHSFFRFVQKNKKEFEDFVPKYFFDNKDLYSLQEVEGEPAFFSLGANKSQYKTFVIADKVIPLFKEERKKAIKDYKTKTVIQSGRGQKSF